MNALEVLQKIETLQVKGSNKYYSKGLFPAQRYHNIFPYQREDSNIYFSAIIAYTLKSLLPSLEKVEQKIAQNIISEAVKNYPDYSSKKDKNVFNFYPTNPLNHYPNGNILSKFKHFALADDADVTAMILLSQQHSISKDDALTLQLLFNSFANGNRKKAKHLAEPYQSLQAYGVWLGTGKMPIEVDLCVLCNILLLAATLNWTEDETINDSYKYILKAIRNNDYINNPFSVSYIYPNPAVIIYHITRLMENDENNNLDDITDKLINDIKVLYKKTQKKMEQLILANSLLRLNSKEPLAINIFDLRDNAFSFFIAPMLSGTGNILLNQLKKSPIFHLQYTCKAYNYALLLENVVYSNKQNTR